MEPTSQPVEQRHLDRAAYWAEIKRKNEAAREGRRADREGVVGS